MCISHKVLKCLCKLKGLNWALKFIGREGRELHEEPNL